MGVDWTLPANHASPAAIAAADEAMRKLIADEEKHKHAVRDTSLRKDDKRSRKKKNAKRKQLAPVPARYGNANDTDEELAVTEPAIDVDGTASSWWWADEALEAERRRQEEELFTFFFPFSSLLHHTT